MPLSRSSSEELSWQLLYKSWPGYFFILDADLKVLACSNDILSLPDVKEYEILGKSISDVYAFLTGKPEDEVAWSVALEHLKSTGRQHKMQPRFFSHPEGQNFIPVNTPVYKADKLLYIINQLEETTVQPDAYLHLSSLINDGVYEVDFLRNQIRWNDQLYHILGYRSGEIELNLARMLRLIHKEDRAAVRDLIRSHPRNRSGFEIEFRLMTKGGHYIDVLSKGMIRMNDKGEPVRLIATIHDISSYKEQEYLKNRLKLITDVIPAMVCYIDRDLRYQFLNTAYQSIYGSDIENLIGKKVHDVSDPEMVKTFFELAHRALKGEKIEVELMKKDEKGDAHYYKTWYVPDKENGLIHGFIGMSMDVTKEKIRELDLSQAKVEKQALIDELRQAQQQIKKEKYILEEFFMEAPSIIAMHEGPEFIIKYLNKNARHLYGDWTGVPFEKIVTKPVYDKLVTIFNEVYYTQKKFSAREFKLTASLVRGTKPKKEAKRDLYFDIVVQPMHDSDGNTTGIIVYANDVTDLAVAKVTLRKNAEKSNRILDAMPIIACTYDGEGKLEYVNQRWFEYTGQEKTNALKAGFYLALHPQDVFKVEFSWSRALAEGTTFEEYIRLKNREGVYRWYHHRVVPIKDENGLVIRWVGSVTDVDDQIKANEKKDEFISIASHELKTPLTSVKAYIQLVQELTSRVREEPISTYLNKAYKNVHKLQELIAELLDVSRIHSGKMELNLRPFKIDDMVREVVENYQFSVSSHKIIFQSNTDLLIYGDRERLEQILYNLLSNAIKYSPEQNEVIVKLYNTHSHVIIDVIDFGIGISKSEQQRLFEQFYRSKKVTKGASGLGMGLYISLAIAKMHGGHIAVQSEEGKGATFSLILPIKPEKAEGDRGG